MNGWWWLVIVLAVLGVILLVVGFLQMRGARPDDSIFPGRSIVPKTLIFAKDDAHAEEIVTTVREVFGKGNDFAAKMTVCRPRRQGPASGLPDLTVAADRGHRRHDRHRHRRQTPRMRLLHARRPIRSVLRADEGPRRPHHHPADFQSVTPDASAKTRFVLVDAVGVTEHDFVDPPLNRDKAITLKKLLDKTATLTLTEDETATLASRLAKLELELTDAERNELDDVAGRSVHAVLIGEDDWRAIQETLLLESVPGMSESIRKARAEGIESGSTELDW